jgi:hypothetical protein
MAYYTNITGKYFSPSSRKSTTVRRLSVKFHGAALINCVSTVNNGTRASLLLAMFTLSYLINFPIDR